ncbi:MAG: hypothetical protein NDJ92_07325, partial [Thermoanaerobaculia bacterium]|nr:hypothetical protein [Thermoanaerobaculia bacterium]
AETSMRVVTLGPRETLTIDDAVQHFGGEPDKAAYLTFTPTTGSVALSATQLVVDAASGGNIGTSVPALPRSSGLSLGQRRRFAAIEDGGPTANAQRIGGTFHNSLGIVEASGAEVTVRATLRYAHSYVGLAAARSELAKEFRLAAGAQLFIPDLARDFIGALRESLRDLHGVELEIEVIGGTGSVIASVLTTDNGTEDLVFRLE